ncbi:MAG: CysS/YqeB C-terminal domain-containing protein, partial [Candidatus Methylomirabilales bacterium]
EERSRPPQSMDHALREKVEALVKARSDARGRRDWAGADRLRDELAQLGVVVEDGPEVTIWKWKP